MLYENSCAYDEPVLAENVELTSFKTLEMLVIYHLNLKYKTRMRHYTNIKHTSLLLNLLTELKFCKKKQLCV